ncbi:hypothetical protein SAMN06272765_7312 [Streptomyces sp. Ag109_G2-15]|nr:hypothetical protein SAMN06272765_7312 [Streptomyces sp. Ag109_G2-15]
MLMSWGGSGGKCRYEGVRPQPQLGIGSPRHAYRHLIATHGLGKVHFDVMVRSDERIAVPAIRALIIGGLQAEFHCLPVGAIEVVAGIVRQKSQERLDVLIPYPPPYCAVPVSLCHPARVPHVYARPVG